MIDRNFQHKGHSRKAQRKIIDYFSSIGAQTVKLSFEPENDIAVKLYAGSGFTDTAKRTMWKSPCGLIIEDAGKYKI